MRASRVAISVLLGSLLLCAEPSWSAAKTDIGTLDNASYRIDVPDHWNHRLIVYYHGFSRKAVIFRPGPPGKVDRELLARGYAIIQSGYSVTGWAVAQALPETEALREYFVSQFGKPSRSYVIGESMGGAITAMTIEQDPERYNGGLALCGRLDSSNGARQKAFAMRAAFDYYFPNVLPPLDPVPQTFQENDAAKDRVLQAMKRDAASSEAMRTLMKLHSNHDVANAMIFTTYVVWDAQQKAGGNPFDNENYIYSGSRDDRALNDGVTRYKADAIAMQYLIHYYTPTGRLLDPMLALATTYDPVTNPSSIYPYELAVEAQGREDKFVQQYVHADGHCNFTPQQIGLAFTELVEWVDDGLRPTPGLLPDAARQAGKEGAGDDRQ